MTPSPLMSHSLSTAKRRITFITLGQAVKLFHSSVRTANKGTLKKTLNLPSTTFNIHSESKREPLFRRRTTESLYKWQRENLKGNQPWFLQDGPPYANGSLHMGHLMNKVLKDIINRYYLLQGRRIFYTPGWDTHGLPIELKVASHELMRAQPLGSADPELICRLAREYAQKQIDTQKTEFKELAILADWEGETYQTFDLEYQMKQLQVIGELADKGLIYRASKPIHYSPSSRTALADAELEYMDNHLSSTVFVPFGLKAGPTLKKKLTHLGDLEVVKSDNSVDFEALIWTTTPWSLPGNMALAVNPKIKYCIARPKTGGALFQKRRFIVALDRVKYLSDRKLGITVSGGASRPTVGELEVTSIFDGEDLLDSTYTHPFLPRGNAYRPILPADYVTADSGTGLVHVAPAHGMEDYLLCLRQGLITSESEDFNSPIDDRGRFTSQLATLNPDAASLVGMTALGEGMNELVQLLDKHGLLLSHLRLQHRYPYDWRTKRPVLMRATPQWFIDVSSLKAKAQAAIEKINFIPSSSKARLEKTIASRNEWCISRQRVWGVPIPVVYDEVSGEPLLTANNVNHIISVLREKGPDYWWKGAAEEFVAPEYRSETETKKWKIGRDTIDVWFDSGVSWIASGASPAAQEEGTESIADLYVEGTDQHRGWFQSSLLTKLAFDPVDAEPQAPFKTVATHGWVLNRRHEKMSKSLGNFIDPLVLLRGGVKKRKEPPWGADTLRLWSAKSWPWESDVNISQLQAKHANEQMMKWRNTARFLLANVPPPEEVPSLEDPEVQAALTLVDRFILYELHGLDTSCRAAYEELNYPGVVQPVSKFMSSTLSTLYFSIIKDTLYSSAPSDPKRLAALAVCDHILRSVVSILAPITPHLAEEIWYYRGNAKRDPPLMLSASAPREKSFFEDGWQKVDDKWDDEISAKKWQKLQGLRDELFSLIEEARKEKWCKSGIELEMHLSLPSSQGGDSTPLQVDDASRALMELCKEHEKDLPMFFNMAYVFLADSPPEPVLNAEGKKIWYLTRDVGSGSVPSVTPEAEAPSMDDFEAFVASATDAQTADPDQTTAAKGEAVGLQLTIRPASSKKVCPRCRIHRASTDQKFCDRCSDVLRAINFDPRGDNGDSVEGDVGENKKEVEQTAGHGQSV